MIKVGVVVGIYIVVGNLKGFRVVENIKNVIDEILLLFKFCVGVGL